MELAASAADRLQRNKAVSACRRSTADAAQQLHEVCQVVLLACSITQQLDVTS